MHRPLKIKELELFFMEEGPRSSTSVFKCARYQNINMFEVQERLHQIVIEGVLVIFKLMLCRNIVFPENTFWKRNNEKYTVFLCIKLKISLTEYVTYIYTSIFFIHLHKECQ